MSKHQLSHDASHLSNLPPVDLKYLSSAKKRNVHPEGGRGGGGVAFLFFIITALSTVSMATSLCTHNRLHTAAREESASSSISFFSSKVTKFKKKSSYGDLIIDLFELPGNICLCQSGCWSAEIMSKEALS